MKIIKSPIRHATPNANKFDGPYVRGWARKAKALSCAKKLARKRDRAQLRLVGIREFNEDTLYRQAERVLTARLQREDAFKQLMMRLKTPKAKRPKASPDRYPKTHARIEIRIGSQGVGGSYSVLASCAA